MSAHRTLTIGQCNALRGLADQIERGPNFAGCLATYAATPGAARKARALFDSWARLTILPQIEALLSGPPPDDPREPTR